VGEEVTGFVNLGRRDISVGLHYPKATCERIETEGREHLKEQSNCVKSPTHEDEGE